MISCLTIAMPSKLISLLLPASFNVICKTQIRSCSSKAYSPSWPSLCCLEGAFQALYELFLTFLSTSLLPFSPPCWSSFSFFNIEGFRASVCYVLYVFLTSFRSWLNILRLSHLIQSMTLLLFWLKASRSFLTPPPLKKWFLPLAFTSFLPVDLLYCICSFSPVDCNLPVIRSCLNSVHYLCLIFNATTGTYLACSKYLEMNESCSLFLNMICIPPFDVTALHIVAHFFKVAFPN